MKTHKYSIITDSTYCVGKYLILKFLFCFVLFNFVLSCVKKCVPFSLFLYVWILFGLGFCQYVEVQRGSIAKELGNIDLST